jgi:acyl-CoA synthetase (AMP-forming)/AMP-acid ligase II
MGIPPFSLFELCVERNFRDRPDEPLLFAGGTSMTARELRSEVVRGASALAARAGPGGRVLMADDLTQQSVTWLFSALAAGLHVRVAPRGSDLPALASEFGAAVTLDRPGAFEPGDEALPPANGHLPDLRTAALTLDSPRGPLEHSQRSLLATALGIATFLDARPGRPWVATVPLSRWEGLASVILPLYLGSPLVLAPPGRDPEELVRAATERGAGFWFCDLDFAVMLTRDARKGVKDARRLFDAFLLSTPGMFDPDERRRVGKSFECPALTVWGMPETGPVFAAHQSWYVDESIGIPVTNVHVVPAEPRSGAPIQALWELVESAEVTVRTPGLMCGYAAGEQPGRFVDGRLRTGMLASSDANGMVYLLGEQQ